MHVALARGQWGGDEEEKCRHDAEPDGPGQRPPLSIEGQIHEGRQAPWGCVASAPYRGTASPPPPPGTHVFYHCMSMDKRVPAIVLVSSPQPGDFLRIKYEVGGKAIVHEAAALHCIEFKIRSSSPSSSLSPPQPHDDSSAGLGLLPGDGLGVDVAKSLAAARVVESEPPIDPHMPPQVVHASSQCCEHELYVWFNL